MTAEYACHTHLGLTSRDLEHFRLKKLIERIENLARVSI
jgi:hypothetical protein